ncbi:MAG TPA: hypothetical protein DCW66_16190 [Sphingobacterium sp.]|nr:hypothetical protein [Sphingobacterium sp.]
MSSSLLTIGHGLMGVDRINLDFHISSSFIGIARHNSVYKNFIKKMRYMVYLLLKHIEEYESIF